VIHRHLKLWFGLISLKVELGIVERVAVLVGFGADDRFGFAVTTGMR
jgi:hypothetical protein